MVTQRNKPVREAARLSLIVAPTLRRRIEREAKREKRTLIAQCVFLIESGLRAEAKKAAA